MTARHGIVPGCLVREHAVMMDSIYTMKAFACPSTTNQDDKLTADLKST